MLHNWLGVGLIVNSTSLGPESATRGINLKKDRPCAFGYKEIIPHSGDIRAILKAHSIVIGGLEKHLRGEKSDISSELDRYQEEIQEEIDSSPSDRKDPALMLYALKKHDIDLQVLLKRVDPEWNIAPCEYIVLSCIENKRSDLEITLERHNPDSLWPRDWIQILLDLKEHDKRIRSLRDKFQVGV